MLAMTMLRLQLSRLLLITAILTGGGLAAAEEDSSTPDEGRIVQSLFRFPASKLGQDFSDLLDLWYDGWLYTTNNETAKNIITPDPSGKHFALQSVSTPATTLFRRQCYGPSPVKSSQFTNLYNNFEQRRKEIEFQYMKDPMEEMNMLHTMMKRFYPAFLTTEEKDDAAAAAQLHKKKVTSTVDTIHANTKLPLDYDSPSKLAFQTEKLLPSADNGNDDDNDNNSPIQQWSWRPAGQFSNRGCPNFLQWRIKFYNMMRTKFQNELSKSTPNFQFDFGRPSGMYWYPPGAVREWHSNYLDLGGGLMTNNNYQNNIYASQMWRMYFIRTVRDDDFDKLLRKLGVDVNSDVDDHSAMHIIPGEDEGITLDVLKKAGARPLTAEETKRQWNDVFAEDYTAPANNNNNSTSIMTTEDDGTTTLDRNSVWRLPDQNGYVTFFRLPKLFHCIVSEEVHRYSLGFAFSDEEVQAMLRYAGIEFDVTGEGDDRDDTTAPESEEDDEPERSSEKDEL